MQGGDRRAPEPDATAQGPEDEGPEELPGEDAVCHICGEPSPYQTAHGSCMADLVGV